MFFSGPIASGGLSGDETLRRLIRMARWLLLGFTLFELPLLTGFLLDNWAPSLEVGYGMIPDARDSRRPQSEDIFAHKLF